MSDRCWPLPWPVWPRPGDSPVGTVAAFAGQLAPAMASPPIGTTAPIEAWGWMACDGRALPTDLYPELFLALGYLYGGSDEESTFSLPNYGGYFMRGIGGAPAVDPDPGTRTKAPGGTDKGVGSTQLSALLSHKHKYPKSTPSGVTNPGEDSGVPAAQQDLTDVPVADDGSDLKSLVSPNETRPINIYVNYIIKFTSGFGPAWPCDPDRGE